MGNELKAIIFDFDGVIAESVNVKTEAFAKMYNQYGNEVVKKVVTHHLSHGGISRFEKFKLYHKELLEIELTNQHLQELANRFSELVVKKVVDAPFVPGALEFIQGNYKYYDLFISSGTPENELKEIMIRKKIYNYFISIFGSPDKKIKHVTTIKKRWNYKQKNILFVGDARSDYEAAKKSNIMFIYRRNTESEEFILDDRVITIADLKIFPTIIERIFDKD